MKELVFFYIRRHFKNKITILINIVIFIAMFFIFNMDLFLQINNELIIYCDNTTTNIYHDLQQIQTKNHFEFSNSQQDYVLHYDAQLKLICKKQLSNEQIESIQNDLDEILKEEYISEHPYLKEYFSYINHFEICVEQNNTNEFIVILSTIIYFLIVNYSSTTASDLVYEKSTSILDTILTNVRAKQHLISKLIIGYLLPLIQIIIVGFEFILNYLIRYNIDKLEGMKNIMTNYIGISVPNVSNISIGTILGIFLLVISGLLLIQTSLLFLVSGFTNSDQATSLIGFIQVIMLIIYYSWIMFIDSSIMNSIMVKILSFIPFLSTLIAPCRIIMNSSSLVEIMIVIISNIGLILLFVNKLEVVYKTNLMKK